MKSCRIPDRPLSKEEKAGRAALAAFYKEIGEDVSVTQLRCPYCKTTYEITTGKEGGKRERRAVTTSTDEAILTAVAVEHDEAAVAKSVAEEFAVVRSRSRALHHIEVIRLPWWMFWITKAAKRHALSELQQLLREQPDVRRTVLQVAIDRGVVALPFVELLVGSGKDRDWNATCAALVCSNDNVRSAIARGMKNDVEQVVKEQPDVRRTVLQVAIDRGAVPLVKSLVGSGKDRDWNATCAALACRTADVRSVIADGMSYYNGARGELEAASNHSELIPALDAALRQGGPRNVVQLLCELVEKVRTATVENNSIEYAKMQSEARRAQSEGKDPSAVFAEYYSGVPIGAVSGFAENAIRDIQNGKYGAEAIRHLQAELNSSVRQAERLLRSR
jgi:hypothetical protein